MMRDLTGFLAAEREKDREERASLAAELEKEREERANLMAALLQKDRVPLPADISSPFVELPL